MAASMDGRRPATLAHPVLQDLGVEQLLAVLPLVQRLGLVEALVALHADERQVEQGGRASASSVLPTPAMPSTRIGLCRCWAMKRAVAIRREAM